MMIKDRISLMPKRSRFAAELVKTVGSNEAAACGTCKECLIERSRPSVNVECKSAITDIHRGRNSGLREPLHLCNDLNIAVTQ